MKTYKWASKFLKNVKHYFKYLIALLYACIICIYPYPNGFDIVRFVGFYHTFQSEEMFGSHFWRILFQTPDFIAKIVIAFLAYTNLPLELFFISFTFTTVYFLFLFFEKYHLYHTHQLPQFSAYLLFTLCLPIGAILSGIRNIHAWSVVLLVFMEYYTTQRKNYGALFYAIAVHFAALLFLPLLLFIDKFQKFSLTKIVVSAFLAGLFIKLLIVFDMKQWIELTPQAMSLKLDFYLDQSVYLIGRLEAESWKAFFYRLLYLYFPIVFIFILNSNKKSELYHSYWFKIGFMYYSLFIFFPDILNRFCMLLNIIALAYILSKKNKNTKMYSIWLFYIISFSLIANYLFWKTVVFYS